MIRISWDLPGGERIKIGQNRNRRLLLVKKIRPAGAGRITRVRRQTGMIATMRNVFGSMIKISSRTMMNL
jgi:hypothetical protein